MEGAADPQRWLTELVQRVADVPGGLERTVFEIQTRDWRTGAALPGATIEQHLRALQRAGARSIGYYPDDFLRDHPPLESVRPTISVSGPRSLTVLAP
jgi:biofilm PGA synthesis lipoprotein PgaB